jgi:hypothetical protein
LSVIYFIQAGGDGGLIKIGLTVDLGKRFSALKSSCPAELTLLGFEHGRREEEKALHRRFAEHRMSGEWFSPHPDIMDTPSGSRKRRKTTSERVDPTKPAAIVVNDRFNGLTHFCRLTGYPTSRVHWWLTKGYIPAERKGESIHSHILTVAAANDVALRPEDFVQTPPALAAAHA